MASDTNNHLFIVRRELRDLSDKLRELIRDESALRLKQDSPYRERGISRMVQAQIDVRNALYEVEQALDCL